MEHVSKYLKLVVNILPKRENIALKYNTNYECIHVAKK